MFMKFAHFVVFFEELPFCCDCKTNAFLVDLFLYF